MPPTTVACRERSRTTTQHTITRPTATRVTPATERARRPPLSRKDGGGAPLVPVSEVLASAEYVRAHERCGTVGIPRLKRIDDLAVLGEVLVAMTGVLAQH